MPTIKEDWITKTRLSALLRAELAIARAATLLLPRLTTARAKGSVEGAARSAWLCAEALTSGLPPVLKRRTPSPSNTLGRLLRWLAGLDEDAALLLLRLVLSYQARRMRWAMHAIDDDGQHLLLRKVLPRRLEGLHHLGPERRDLASSSVTS